MARPTRRPPEDGGPIAEFAAALLELRKAAGLTVRELACKAHYSPTMISVATAGRTAPSESLTIAYVRGCGGSELDIQEWLHRRAMVVAT